MCSTTLTNAFNKWVSWWRQANRHLHLYVKCCFVETWQLHVAAHGQPNPFFSSCSSVQAMYINVCVCLCVSIYIYIHKIFDNFWKGYLRGPKVDAYTFNQVQQISCATWSMIILRQRSVLSLMVGLSQQPLQAQATVGVRKVGSNIGEQIHVQLLFRTFSRPSRHWAASSGVGLHTKYISSVVKLVITFNNQVLQEMFSQ